MSLQRTLATLALTALFAFSATPAHAQWKTQTIELNPGWNAVFLEVQPEPDDTELVFAGLPVESVWTWNRKFSSVQFVQDPSTLVPEQPEWLRYFPDAAEKGFLNNLFSLRGGRPYLVKLRGSQPVQWVVTGQPKIRPLDWMPDSFNFVGFNVDPASPPSFEAFLAPSPALASSEVYGLDESGEWSQVADLGASVAPGTAYWVYCHGSSSYPGPVKVTLEQGGRLDFGRIVDEQVVRLKNETAFAKQITLSERSSASPPSGAGAVQGGHGLASVAGDVPLSYWAWDDEQQGWEPLSGSLVLPLAAGQEIALRLAVRRPDMSGATAERQVYQSLLELKDGDGMLLSVPVVAEHATDRAGLWVGTASVDAVSFAASPDDKQTPQPAASEMQIRLIVHVDEDGQARLLQKVTLMWKDGTMKSDPDDPSKQIVDEPGSYVLLTRDDLISDYSGAALRDGIPVGRRISSAAFSFGAPIELSGEFDQSLTTGDLTIGFNDPLNPFKHKYHPDHDNLDYDFETALPEGYESYDVVRNISLTFTAADPDGLNLPGWGDSQVGGSYTEWIDGLHKKRLHVAGRFRLHRVSRTGVLNDGRGL